MFAEQREEKGHKSADSHGSSVANVLLMKLAIWNYLKKSSMIQWCKNCKTNSHLFRIWSTVSCQMWKCGAHLSQHDDHFHSTSIYVELYVSYSTPSSMALHYREYEITTKSQHDTYNELRDKIEMSFNFRSIKRLTPLKTDSPTFLMT